MRHEHRYHVAIVIFMMLIVLGTFIFVIINKSEPSITTYIPPISETSVSDTLISNNSNINVNPPASENYSTTIAKNILIYFLIALALLFIVYVSIKITKELKNRNI